MPLDRGRNRTTSPVGVRYRKQETTDTANPGQVKIHQKPCRGRRPGSSVRRRASTESTNDTTWQTGAISRSLNFSEPSQSSASESAAGRSLSSCNSNVKRQIIRPWEDNKERGSLSQDHLPLPSLQRPDVPISNPVLNQTEPVQSVTDGVKLTQRQSAPFDSCVAKTGQALPVIAGAASSLRTKDTSHYCLESMSEPHSTENTSDSVDTQGSSSDFNDNGNTTCSREIKIGRGKLLSLFEMVTVATEASTCEELERLYATFRHLVFRYRMTADRGQLLQVSAGGVSCLAHGLPPPTFERI